MRNPQAMVHRRDVLAIAATASVGSLAGCSDILGDGGGDGQGEEDGQDGTPGQDGDAETDTTTTDADTDDASELIHSARSNLADAASEFESQSDQLSDPMSGEQPSLDTSEMEERLDAAEADLTAARNADPTDDQRQEIEALDTLVELLRSLQDLLVDAVDAFGSFREANTYIQRDQFEAAIDPLRAGEDNVDQARDSLTVARSQVDDIDADHLDDFDEFDREELEGALDDIDIALGGLDVLLTGIRQMVQGMPLFREAVEARDREEWGTAADKFDEASKHYTASLTTFEEAIETGPAEFRDDFEELACQVAKLSDAADNFRRAMTALDEGDDASAQEYISKGEAALDREC